MNWAVLRRRSARVVSVLMLLVVVLVGAFVVNLVGIRLAGGIEGWQQWLSDRTGYFLAWRVLLYAGTAWGWLWMRRRVLARDTAANARQRLRRVEVAAVVGVVALEVGYWLQGD